MPVRFLLSAFFTEDRFIFFSADWISSMLMDECYFLLRRGLELEDVDMAADWFAFLSFLNRIGRGFLLGLPLEEETDPLFFGIELLLLETLRGLDLPRLLIVCLDNLSISTLLLASSTF